MNDIHKKIKILAVDDIPSNLIALESVFYKSNYQLIEASSGAEALSILAQDNDIALVLLDVQMPHMDGFETAMKIKQMEHCKDLPIIFITAVHTEDPFVKKGYESGAIDYFSKPFDPEILKTKVELYASFRQKSFLLKERELRILQTEELFKVGKKLAGIFESLTVGVLIADKDGKIFQTNEVVSKILKATEHAENDSYGHIIGWWDNNGQVLKEEHSALWQALREGRTTHNELITIRCLDDSAKRLLCSASPLQGLDKQIVGAVIVIQDVTETKKIEEAFEQRISNLISIGVELEQSLNP